MTATAPDSTVLLVEDDADMAANMGEYLERRGWSVHYASTGALALHLAAERDFAVIVLDRGLPLIDGLEVGRRGWPRGCCAAVISSCGPICVGSRGRGGSCS